MFARFATRSVLGVGALGIGARATHAAAQDLEDILHSMTVQPWGVLGLQLTSARQVAKRVAAPDEATAFVDPAGLPYVRSNQPGGAGAASRAVYDFVGMQEFPESVRHAITEPTHARHFAYTVAGTDATKYHVIHVVGPDFRQPGYGTADTALLALAGTYTNVLREFCEARERHSELTGLRLLPVSGGVFSGPYSAELPRLTMEALRLGYRAQPKAYQQLLCSSRIDLCVFLEGEYEAYEAARQAATCGGRSRM